MFIDSTTPMSVSEKLRLQQLDRDFAERDALQKKAREEEEKRQAVAAKKARNLEKRVIYEDGCRDAELLRLKKNRELLPELASITAFRELPSWAQAKYLAAFEDEDGNWIRALDMRSKLKMSESDFEKLSQNVPIARHTFDPPEPEFEQ